MCRCGVIIKKLYNMIIFLKITIFGCKILIFGPQNKKKCFSRLAALGVYGEGLPQGILENIPNYTRTIYRNIQKCYYINKLTREKSYCCGTRNIF